jgi:rhodanese-related sulfurtransferase
MDSIGLFQLENLVLSRSPFVFIDLRQPIDDRALPEPLSGYLKLAQRIGSEEVKAHLQKNAVDKNKPVLLLSANEVASVVVARDLEAAGYANVYIVAGGLDGLLSEL